MNQIEVIISANRNLEDLVVDMLYEYEIEGISVEDDALLFEHANRSPEWELIDLPDIAPGETVRLHVFFEEEAYAGGIETEIRERIEDFVREYGEDAVRIEKTEPLTDSDWQEEWKKYFKPTAIGERIVIVPSWENYEPKEGEITIELDPGMAFGTGTHASTSMCLELLQETELAHRSLLDVGCGSGILSIAAAKLGASPITAIDIDPICIRTTAENAKINQVDDRIEVKTGDLTLGLEGKYDLIVANLIAEIVVRLTEQIGDFIHPGTVIITSGILVEKEALVIHALTAAGFSDFYIKRENGWSAIRAVAE